ncbi:MAG: alpha-glucan phosphorylase, partial [Verrucomicrobiota bacterium]|nr:alpha-glucan phosphorylase [Verrucomicrobiota bacterium]
PGAGCRSLVNNPLRPMEASGTSGMKCAPNGGINLSVLDGWWHEGFNGNNGWAIAAEISDGTVEFQSAVDANSLYQLLENQIIPLYYAKPDGKLPLAWLQLMRESIRSVTPVFNTHRMVKEYTERLYEPAAAHHRKLMPGGSAKASEISRWKTEMRKDWPQIRVAKVDVLTPDGGNIFVGDSLKIAATIHLGKVDPANVRVQAYYGETDDNSITRPAAIDLDDSEKLSTPGDYLYRGTIRASESGAYGFNVRVIPKHPNLTQAHELRLITWAN